MNAINGGINKNRKLWYKIIMGIAIVLSILYFKVFFTYGVRYDNVFLKKETVEEETQYTGRTSGKKMVIKVKKLSPGGDEFHISYDIGNKTAKTYVVSFGASNQQGQEVVIKDERDMTWFEGRYDEGNMFLLDQNDRPVFGALRVLVGDEYGTEWPAPASDPHGMIKIVKGEDNSIRGRITPFILALIILGINLIDMAFPTFFFELKYSFAVDNPEPSDFYRSTQKISWYVINLVVIIMLITAIW